MAQLLIIPRPDGSHQVGPFTVPWHLPHKSAKALNTPHLHIFIFSFELHDNALALHEYTRHERKKAARKAAIGQGDGFDGELDNFQEPELSSLVRLVRLYRG